MSSPIRVRPLLIACLLFITACSASGGQAEPVGESTTSTTQDTTVEETTTTVDEPTTTTSESAGDAPSLDALAALLPEAADLGPVWTEVDEDDDEDEELLEDLQDQCPELARFENDTDTSVGRTYEDADGFRFELRFNRDLGPLADKAATDQLIDDYRACEIDIEEDGMNVLVHFTVDRRSDLGPIGLELQGHATLVAADLEVDFTLYSFVTTTDNGVVVSTSTYDQIDESGELQPVNSELFPQLMSELAAQIEAL